MSDLEYMISKLDSLLQNLGRAERYDGSIEQIFYTLSINNNFIAVCFNGNRVPGFKNYIKECSYSCTLVRKSSGYHYEVSVRKNAIKLDSISLIFKPKDNIYIFNKYNNNRLVEKFKFNSELSKSDIFNLYLNIDYVNELIEILKITMKNTSVFQQEIEDYY